MSLERGPIITPIIEELQKLKIEKREIESIMAFTEPDMESYQRRIMVNLNSIDARIEELKKVIREGYIIKVIMKKRIITKYNEILKSLEAPDTPTDHPVKAVSLSLWTYDVKALPFDVSVCIATIASPAPTP